MANLSLQLYNKAFLITKSDTVNLVGPSADGLCDAIYVGGTGDVVAVFQDDSTATFSGVPAGALLPLRLKRVNSSSTTATLMLALYQV